MLTPDEALRLARDAYDGSTSYFNANIRPQLERDIRAFQSRHAPDSKYMSEAYRTRSKFFRPKTRSMVRKNEADAAEAFFSNLDVVSLTAENEEDKLQQAGAEVMKALMQYRLTKTVPWFITCMGAFQDAQVSGVCISHQTWKYDPKKGIDTPAIELIPLENFRFDPAASWLDPVGTSPYLVWEIPMHIKDIKARMRPGPNGEPAKWKTLTEAELKTAVKRYDSTRLLREDNRADSRDSTTSITDFTIAWVHMNVMEVDGVDYYFYTLGTQHLLSNPAPLADKYAHGRRPFVAGFVVIETHKTYPGGPVRLGREPQNEINEIANLRADNVKFAMNKRYFVKRNKQVDIRSLTRNVPGSVTLLTDPEVDVKVVDTPDVTASSYNEQDRLNMDFDDITGVFANGSVQGNRRLNETVGGMELLSNNANKLSNYQLKTFVETWVEPVLRQLILLEQSYETDDKVLALAGQRAKLQRFGLDAVTDELLLAELTLTVDVGMGHTSPDAKINNLIRAVTAVKEALADGSMEKFGIDAREVIKEIFSAVGYRNGGKFFASMDQNDPRVVSLQAQVQELQQELEAKFPSKLLEAQVDLLRAQAKNVEAQKVAKGVEATYAAMQSAEVIASAPEVAPIADKVMQAAGYTQPNPAGVDPNFPVPGEEGMPGDAGPGITPAAMEAVKTGPVNIPESGNTHPMFPGNPESAAAGAHQGIETERADG